MKPRRNLYGIHNDFSAVAGGLRRGCILIRNRDGVGMLTFLEVAHMVDATALIGWGGVGMLTFLEVAHMVDGCGWYGTDSVGRGGNVNVP